MTAFANIFNKIFAVFFSVLLTLTGGLNGLFEGEVYSYESEHAVVGLESLTRSQDVTTDGEYFYFSGKHALEKVNLACIPKDNGAEAWCYEIKAVCKNKTFLIYVNTKTGHEEEIMMVVEDTNGSLTI